MNVLLVMPYMDFDNTKYLSSRDSAFPIGLGYIAAVLENADHQVQIYDFQISKKTIDKFKTVLSSGQFDIIGFSVTTITRRNTLHLVQICKDVLPGCSIIVGGPYPTVYPKELISQSDAIDFEVVGEGEETIVELMQCIEHQKDFGRIAGIVYRSGKIPEQTELRPLIKSLDDIPFPAFHLFELKGYTPPPGMFFKLPLRHMITSRGCPFNCIFCDDRIIWRGMCRQRSAENIVEEMIVLKNHYGAREIHFYDDTFTVNKKRIYRFCELLRENKTGLIWRCSSRVDTVDKDMLSEMRGAGCRSISFGIESGDDRILEKMNKGTTVAQARDAVKWTNEAGIQAKGFFMLNFPGDTINTTEKTIALAKELELDFVGFNLTTPHHGDRLKKLVEENYELNEKAYYDTSAKLGNEIYFYQPDLPEKYLREAYSKIAREFYLRPKYIIKMICGIRNFAMLKSYIAGFFRLFKIGV
ncbi:MAG: radical SAM protein [Desulfobacterales bacterium]|nr:radical SAM protein [Desulfobacterales bacterium]